MFGCRHLDRRGRRGHDHLGGAGGLDRRRRLRDRHHRRGLDDRRGRNLWLGDDDSCGLLGLGGRLLRRLRRGLRRLGFLRLLGTDQPIAFGPPPHSICLCLFDARGMALDANSERDREVECLLVGHPELFGQLVEADLCGQGCNQPFGWGLGEISSRARQPMGLSSAVAHSRMSGPISAHRSSNERR
jgi:hypothetical protein